MKAKGVGLVLLVSLFLAKGVLAADGPLIEMFSPQGTVKNVRQVSVRFSEPMVAFSDPGGLIEPFDVQCPEKGTARWADGRNWIFDFERDLPAGVNCEFRLKPGIKTLSGKEITGSKEFSFSTGGPSIMKGSFPYEGSQSIDEEQIFILVLDGEPDLQSLIPNVFFSIAGIEDHVGIKIIEGREREAILKSRFRYRRPPELPMILVQCKQPFPSDTRISLVWGKGVKSKTGVATDQDQILRFQTRKPFSVEFHCERENPRAGCVPITPMSLHFSAPISKDQASRISLKGADGKIWRPQLGKREEMNEVPFQGPFPESMSFTMELPAGLKDDAGRALINADKFPLSIRTDRYPPLAKFSARFGILERKADPVLPVTLRNLEPQVNARLLKVDKEEGIVGRVTGKILNLPHDKGQNLQAWLRKVATASREESILGGEKEARDFKIPKPMGAQAFEVVGIPLDKSGLYIVELESALLGKALLDPPGPMYVPTAVLVTNLSVHFKWGRESSLVWVTALDTGEPVKDAVVTVRDCREKILWNGKTDSSGIARIQPSLPSWEETPSCEFQVDRHDHSQMSGLEGLSRGLFVTVQTKEDIAFVHSSWDDGIEPWRFQLPRESYSGPFIGHTIFDRTLLRAGETVHMKHLFRQHTTKGFSSPPRDRMPNFVLIQHEGSQERYEFPLKWDGNGIAETTWAIPREAKLGTYEVDFIVKDEKGQQKWEWVSGTFRVEEFRVPLLKGVIQPPKDPLINVREVTLDLNVQYLAGGGAGLLPIKLRSELRPKSIPAFEGFDYFTFGNGPVKEGIVRRGAALELEETEASEEDTERGERPSLSEEMRPLGIDLVLDRSGSARATVSPLPKVNIPEELLAEMEFRDPNGEIQTVSSRIPLWPSRYLIGIKPDSWALSKEAFKFYVAIVDLSGKPIPGAWTKVTLFERKTYTHRKRLVGGFYAYDHTVETKRIGELCEGRMDSKGLLLCEVQSPVSGNVILEAEGLDDLGNKTFAHKEVWVAGKGEWWFEAGDHDRIDLLPEKKRYEPGEKAIFQVRMPFRNAMALITVEREGVMDAWIQRISGKTPVIEVPVHGNYAPNVFVSVLAVRGRLPWIKATSMVDLGKPAYKLGIAEINVGWKAHELKVTLSSDRKVYKVREKAKVKIQVTTFDGKKPPAGSEIAVAAVDEGLLELMPNRSWEILPAMMGRRGYGIHTATAQMQVIGKRHFGLKALPQGGGGGRQTTRELFDTLLLWKARLLLDAYGEASVEVPLNDSITGFRIVAVANGGIGLFGTGSTSIQSTQELMILSGLPPLIREGDRFSPEFTLRNTTHRRMEVDAFARVDGISKPLNPIAVSLPPGEARVVEWEVVVPQGIEGLSWELEAREKGSNEVDRLGVKQKVVPVTPVSTFQATIVPIERDLHVPVERPKDAIPGQGGVKVNLRPKIVEGLNGVIDYMRKYPYTCMEQKVSVAIALRDEKRWNGVVSQLPSHLDSDGLVKYFPTSSFGSPILTSYIVAIAHEAEWAIPDETRGKMEMGLRRFIEGSIIRYSPIPTADLSIRKLSAIEALSRSNKAEVKLLSSISIEPNLWPTSAVIDWLNILLRVKGIPNRDGKIAEAEQILRSRLNVQGTTMGFSTEKTDALWWLMISNDVNAVRMILSLLPSEKWKEEMPRLVQGALGRLRRGSWDLTVANAWGVLAMERFSRAFEAVPVTGTTLATLSAHSQTTDWNTTPKGSVSSFPWPLKREGLSISHQGTGRPWATIQSLAALPLKEPLSSGYKIQKTILPVEQKTPPAWSRGDILRIRLEVEAQADQTWVVVSDPVPAGTTILGKGLGRDSELLTKGEERKDWVWPIFEERSFEAFRAYYEYLPKGKWAVEYTIRLNQSGSFHLPTTRVEALYFPEMFGEMPNKAVEVHPQ